MRQAAVIQRVAQAAGTFADAAPGHRFNLYFPIWGVDWKLDSKGKTAALKDCTALPGKVVELLAGVRACQREMFDAQPDGLRIIAVSTAPFATGLGNEHPVENGFAFLTPYGLPYLAGSGVKSVLRRAAEERALFADEYPSTSTGSRLTMLDIWWLFGFEGAAGAWWPLTRKESRDFSDEQKERRARWRRLFQEHIAGLVGRPDLPDFIKRAITKKEEQTRYLNDPALFLNRLDSLRQEVHTRGALDFWDVFPQPPQQGPYKNSLAVEIMTPHFGDYYQGKTTPHDASQPNPIPFLALPVGSSFDFHVICHVGRLPEGLRGRWKAMLESICAHAFDWLGFGAKTAVGYGAVKRDEVAEQAAREAELAAAAARHQAQLAAMTPNMRRIEEFKEAFAARERQLLGGKDRQNTAYHDRARKLAKDALAGADWTAEEKRAAAEAIAEWLPRVVERIDKEQLKKLRLGMLRGQA